MCCNSRTLQDHIKWLNQLHQLKLTRFFTLSTDARNRSICGKSKQIPSRRCLRDQHSRCVSQIFLLAWNLPRHSRNQHQSHTPTITLSVPDEDCSLPSSFSVDSSNRMQGQKSTTRLVACEIEQKKTKPRKCEKFRPVGVCVCVCTYARVCVCNRSYLCEPDIARIPGGDFVVCY